MKDFWNQRYADKAYAYGKEPNAFFKTEIEKLNPGNILLPAEGEGRNAIYAAKIGWNVEAFDISEEGRKKAMQLAIKENVNIKYQVGEIHQLDYQQESFDVVALVFAHFPPHIKNQIYNTLINLLKPGGLIILEGFSKNNLAKVAKNPNIGGPKDTTMLLSEDELKQDFENFQFLYIEEVDANLNEGLYHVGEGSLIRMIAQKNNTHEDTFTKFH